MARTKKTKITPQDLYKMKTIIGARISPDGNYVAYTQQRVDRSSEKKYSNIWIVPTRGGKPRQFTYGDQNDVSPRWSADGSQIAFVSNRLYDKQFQLYIIPFSGGEARPVTDMKGTFSYFEWAPNGKEIVISFRNNSKEEIERDSDPKKKEKGIVYRHYDKVFFKMDGEGFFNKEHFNIHIVELKSGNTRQISRDGSNDNTQPRWAPDGCSILYISNREPDPGLEPYSHDIFLYDLKKGKERKLALPMGQKFNASFSPDGKWIVFTGKEGKGKWWRIKDLFLVETKGNTDRICLTKDLDIELGNYTLNDVEGHPATFAPIWSPDSSFVYFQTLEQGRTCLAYIDIEEEGYPIHYLVNEECVVGDATFDSSGDRFAFHRMDMYDAGNIWVGDLGGDDLRKLTDVNSLISKVASEMHFEEVWVDTPDKKKVNGWIIKPPNFNKRKKYPSILEIHGGPRAQYGFSFMHEFFYLASQGYVVHFCNPRGSQGYGEEHAGAIWKVWGTHDYNDAMFWTDHISELPYIDTKRMGVTGGSYGGYMTNLIIGKTDRFKAAVTQRSVSNFISMWGSSDFNWMFQDEFSEAPPWENVELLWEQSPMKYIGNAKTPTLVIHSENDLRCDMEQGEQVYVALKKLGVPSELLRFPDSPHGLSRMGRTDRRIVRLEHIKSWFDRFIR